MTIDKGLLFEGVQGFDWDYYNENKNIFKHNVSTAECEQIFFNLPLLINDDLAHGDEDEERYLAFGRTDENRKLFVAFEIRNQLIRPISFRDMEKPERAIYEKYK